MFIVSVALEMQKIRVVGVSWMLHLPGMLHCKVAIAYWVYEKCQQESIQECLLNWMLFSLSWVIPQFSEELLVACNPLCDGAAFWVYIIHSFILLARAECNNSLSFSAASSFPLCFVLFPATLFHQLFFHPVSPHLALYFLFYLSILLFPNSYIILFWEFYFLPFSIHAQTNVIYLTLLSLL